MNKSGFDRGARFFFGGYLIKRVVGIDFCEIDSFSFDFSFRFSLGWFFFRGG